MANELETPSFSIQDTMEMSGNQELLDNFLSTETVTAKSEDVTKVTPPAKKEEAKKAEVKKEEPKDKTKEKKEEEKKGKTSDELADEFLSDEEKENKEKEEKNKNEDSEEGKEKGEEEQTSEIQFNNLAQDLFKLGVFNKEEGEEDVEINSPEEFLERFQHEKKKGAIDIVQNFIGQFGEDYQEAFDAIFVKGVNPKEYFTTYNAIQDLASVDLKVEANQVAVISQNLADAGYEPDEIKAEIERLKSYGDLEVVAQRAHKAVMKKDAARLEQLKVDNEKKLAQAQALRSQYMKNVHTILQDKLKTKEFDGIPVNPKLAAEVQDFLVAEKYTTRSGEKLTEFDKAILDLKNPDNHEKKVKLALLLKILEKDPTLSTIQKATITKKTDTLFATLARQEKSTNKAPEKDKPSSWFV